MTAPALAQARQRPLSDFINAQGTGHNGNNTCWTDPAPTQFGWGEGCFDDSCADVKSNGNAKNRQPFRFAMIDYTGLTARYLTTQGINLGTTVSGTVTERPLADGRALVSVDVHTKNALGWVFDWSNAGPDDPCCAVQPLSFGYRAQDLIANRALKPSLGDSSFKITFTNTAPGLPLPDVVCTTDAPPGDCTGIAVCPAGYEVDSLQFEASITGPLHQVSGLGPEGTPGRLAVQQVGLFRPGALNKEKPPGPLVNGYPVESITLHATGK